MTKEAAMSEIVETTAGKIEGTYKNGLHKFAGVPFAAPPTGSRRWLPPEPVARWSGVRPAQKFATTAPQNPMAIPVLNPPQPEPQDEDCLYLNIWTPGLDNTRRPVMFWIHGGGFTSGSGSTLAYNGRTLAKRGNTVIITTNYRLGALGFLNLNEITGGKIPATGNEGLLDQAFALGWVRDNIAAFGGDPDNVTIFGESAGGMSVACLLAMPKAKGLFHKAILQSGAAHTIYSKEQATHAATILLDILGTAPDDIDGLQSLSTKQLLAAQQELVAKGLDWKSGLGVLPFQPVVDGEVLPQPPLEAIANGSAKNIPVMIGTTSQEWKLFAVMDQQLPAMDEAKLLRRCQRLVPAEAAPNLIAAYRKALPKSGLANTPAELFTAIQTDRLFRIPAIRLAEAQRQYQPVYVYLFTWTSPYMGGALGACHALELGFLFGTLEETFSGSKLPGADTLAKNLQDAWLAFARTGNPSSDSLGKWPPYGDSRETMLLGRECTLAAAPFDEERRAWESISL
jgi:para-nitrobenzyl esterase